MARQQLRREAAKLIKVLEARGHPFLQSSKADISVSELEEPSILNALQRLTALPYLLGFMGEGRSLSLTEAQGLYQSTILDTLCSVLSRLKWTDFCMQLHHIPANGRGFAHAGRCLDCVYELLAVWRRVQPPSDVEASQLEIFGRYVRMALASFFRNSDRVQLVNNCTTPRFQSCVLHFLHRTIVGLADITAAVGKTGERAHVGYLIISKLTSSVQMVSLPALCPLCSWRAPCAWALHSTSEQQR